MVPLWLLGCCSSCDGGLSAPPTFCIGFFTINFYAFISPNKDLDVFCSISVLRERATNDPADILVHVFFAVLQSELIVCIGLIHGARSGTLDVCVRSSRLAHALVDLVPGWARCSKRSLSGEFIDWRYFQSDRIYDQSSSNVLPLHCLRHSRILRAACYTRYYLAVAGQRQPTARPTSSSHRLKALDWHSPNSASPSP